MSISPYRTVLGNRSAVRIMLLGFILRIPIFSAAVILTLHVVQTLGRSYTDAGLVSAVATVAIAVSGPWRGRLLDRLGLRRVVLPSLIVSAVVWMIAPFVGYWWLLVLAAIGGLFVVPTFSIVRQGVIAAVPESQRRTALSLDGVVVELSFMVGPLAAVWLSTVMSTRYVLLGIEMIGVVFGAVLWWSNPPLRGDADLVGGMKVAIPRSRWLRGRFLAVCSAAVGATIVLTGSDVGIVAAMRDFGQVPKMGAVLLFWSLGSVVGGLLYGALSRPISPFLLLFGLAVTTIPMGFAPNMWWLAGTGVVAGLFCAPTITATVDAVARVVPESARGEAMGWHGSFMTAGSAIGAPVGGLAIDRAGYAGGFVLVSLIGAALAVVGAAAVALRRRGRLSVAEVDLAA
ncbi:MFS transporter [Calidifontibacter terrae]